MGVEMREGYWTGSLPGSLVGGLPSQPALLEHRGELK